MTVRGRDAALGFCCGALVWETNGSLWDKFKSYMACCIVRISEPAGAVRAEALVTKEARENVDNRLEMSCK